MFDKEKIFQYAMLGLFTVLGLIGVIILAIGWDRTSNEEITGVTGPTVIWGPSFEDGGIKDFISDQQSNTDVEVNIFEKTKYVEKNPETLYSDLLDAIATGNGPDAVIVDASMMLPLKDKISVRDFTSFPILSFQDAYVEGAEIFTFDDGVYAYPLVVDPIVLFWNRDLFTNAGIAQVPQNWDMLLAYVPKLTIRDRDNTIQQGTISFGEYTNVLHAREVLSALFFQTGAHIVESEGGKFVSDMRSDASGDKIVRTDIALRFYTDFANPQKEAYSWNRTFQRSREAFAANRVAMYPGFSSEYDIIEKINPNLNFSVAVLPQSATGKNRATYGKFYGIAVLKSSKNIYSAHLVAQELASTQSAKGLQELTGLPTVRRDSLADDPKFPEKSIASRSVLIARDWLQPDVSAVHTSMQSMVESITENKGTLETSIGSFIADLDAMLTRYNK